MTAPCVACLWSVRRVVGAALCAGMLASAANAQTPGPGRNGGLLPTREAPSVSGGQSRDEMLRRFDLDADGRIDSGEAEAARIRMRRERLETSDRPGIDPRTGRPRGDASTTGAGTVPAPRDDELLLPSGRPTGAAPGKRGAEAGRNPAAETAPVPTPGRIPALTGGVRAGAPAVRYGYGASAPQPDLNAGRPRGATTPSATNPSLPGMRPTSRPGRQPALERTAPPRPSLFPRGSARPTAEDIGQ